MLKRNETLAITFPIKVLPKRDDDLFASNLNESSIQERSSRLTLISSRHRGYLLSCNYSHRYPLYFYRQLNRDDQQCNLQNKKETR